MTRVTIPDSVTNIGNGAFYDCKLTSIAIPDSVITIGASAFYSCAALTNVAIPNAVTSIGSNTFQNCTSLANVTLGSSITNIGRFAFYACTGLRGVYFRGNAPALGASGFVGDTQAIVYYLPGTTGWGTTFGGRPTMLWNPTALTSDSSFGVHNNRFGFTIAGTANIPFVVEACSDFSNPTWFLLQSCTLTNGSVYFSDPQWTNYPTRFYRIRSP